MAPQGILVPPGFASTAPAFRAYLASNRLNEAIANHCAALAAAHIRPPIDQQPSLLRHPDPIQDQIAGMKDHLILGLQPRQHLRKALIALAQRDGL